MDSLNNSVEVRLSVTGEVPTCYIPDCKYGTKCYRKNPVHFREFCHRSIFCGTKTLKFLFTKDDSFSNLSRRVQSFFDCRYVTFTLSESIGKCPLNEHTWRGLLSAYSDSDPFAISIVAHFTTVPPTKVCSKCCHSLSFGFYFQCLQCSHLSYYLCTNCETRNHHYNYHDSSHMFVKVYPHQQSIDIHNQIKPTFAKRTHSLEDSKLNSAYEYS